MRAALVFALGAAFQALVAAPRATVFSPVSLAPPSEGYQPARSGSELRLQRSALFRPDRFRAPFRPLHRENVPSWALLGAASGAAALLALRPRRAVCSVTARLGERSPVFAEFAALGAETGAVNLGQGFPDSTPSFVQAAAAAALSEPMHHQYTRTSGHPALVALLAERYSAHLERSVDPASEVAVTVGASQALFASFQALVRPGDEVILFEPFFDLYVGQVRLAGGEITTVPLVPGSPWTFDLSALETRLASPRARVLVLNSPHNPSGKVFSQAEMEAIAGAVKAFASEDLVVIADEVYKYIVQDGEHVHFASLPEMASRTLTVSSAGKTFGATGWQVGWVIGDAPLIAEVQALLPFLQFCASTPMQAALVTAITDAELPFEGEENYYAWLTADYRRRRAKLREILTDAGLAPFQGGGGVFLLADVSAHIARIPAEFREGYADDWAFCRWLAIEYGVLAIPTSSFYASPDSAPRPLVRFAFCKSDETLEAARGKFARFAEEARVHGVVEPVAVGARNPSPASS